jgi:hypothetical protein
LGFPEIVGGIDRRAFMKSGYWGNFATGKIFEIDEHENWIRRGDNASKLDIPAEVIAEFGKFKPHQDRDPFLLFLFASAAVMRIRGHGEYITFEFNSEDWAAPLKLVEAWCIANAGPFSGLMIVNLGTNSNLQCLWKDFKVKETCRTHSPDWTV